MKWTKAIYSANLYNRNLWVEHQARLVAPGSRVLDAGAGTGPYRKLFNHCDYRAQDFERTPAILGRYTQLFYRCDITAIPEKDGYFDVILCTEVLEHVPKPIDVISEFARLLKGNGKLLLTAPLGSFLHQEPYHYYGGYTPYWYKHFLEAAGLEIVEIIANGGFFQYFAQECIRFGQLTYPLQKGCAWQRRIGLGITWCFTVPLFWGIAPWLAKKLDSLKLTDAATVGYHVVARKRI